MESPSENFYFLTVLVNVIETHVMVLGGCGEDLDPSPTSPRARVQSGKRNFKWK